jgi:hypothetical protein
LKLLALPREAHHSGNFNGLGGSLGEKPPIELQSVSTAQPKPSQPSFPIIIAEWDRNSREIIRVALDLYNGRHTINARVWYRDGDDVKPSKSGLTLSVTHLPALAEAIGRALASARDLGLIEGPGNEHGR